MRPLRRITPILPVSAMKTYSISTPQDTHFRKATCKEVDCEHYLNGWMTTVLANSDDERLIRRAGRHFTVEKRPDGFLRFVFHAGQTCFAAVHHRVPLEREPFHVVRDGDWRGNPTRRRTGLKANDWLDSFQEDTARTIAFKERG